MNQRGMSGQFAAVIIALILVSATVLGIIQHQKSNTNATNTAEDNVNVVMNTNSLNANTNTSDAAALSISDVIANAARYNNTRVCLTAWYQNSFEFSAMAESVRIVNGQKVLSEPYVWIDVAVPQTSLTCTPNDSGQTICQGVATVCGTFSAATGDQGFGHLAAYRYKLSSSAPIKNTPSVNIDTQIDTTNTNTAY